MKKAISTLIILFIITSYNYCQNTKLPDKLRFFEIKESNQVSTASTDFNTKNAAQSENVEFGDAPDVGWSKQFGGSAEDFITSVKTDSHNNIYVTGVYSETMTVQNVTLSSVGIREAFLAKFCSEGNLIWLNSIPSNPGFETYLTDLYISPNNKLFILGHYTGGLTIEQFHFSNYASQQVFYAELDTAGNFTYVSNMESYTGKGVAIDINKHGDIYIASAFTNRLYEDVYTSFIFKYNYLHDLQWIKYVDKTIDDLIVEDTLLYLSGNYKRNQLDFDSVSLPYPVGFEDIFVAKADMEGTVFSAFTLKNVVGYGSASRTNIEIDDEKNILLTGCSRTGISTDADSIMNGGTFIAKFNLNGDNEWITKINEYVNESNLDVDSDGFSYIASTGVIYKIDVSGNIVELKPINKETFAVDINNLDEIIIGSDLYGRIEFLKLDESLKLLWKNEWAGTSAIANVVAMVTDNDANIYSLCETSNSINFENTDLNKSLFLTKHNANGDLIWINEFPYQGESIVWSQGGNFLNIDTVTNHLYIATAITDTLIISDIERILPSTNGKIVILKLDLDGKIIWAKTEDFQFIRFISGSSYRW